MVRRSILLHREGGVHTEVLAKILLPNTAPVGVGLGCWVDEEALLGGRWEVLLPSKDVLLFCYIHGIQSLQFNKHTIMNEPSTYLQKKWGSVKVPRGRESI